MRVIKRTGESVKFDGNKISEAVRKAFIEVDGKLTDYAIYKSNEIATYVGSRKKRRMTVEDIQVEVIKKLMASKRKDVAIAYTEYRYKRNLARQINTTDESIIELLNGTSDYWNNENSNKDSKNVTVQRDYLAGITSTDISRRFLLPEDVVKAHDAGIIHFHDMDYFGQKVLSNCSLCNLEDMLQNGTVINGVMIEKPHRLITATTIATQIITAVTSSQYGGVSISLTHLAPFVRDSYERYYQKYIDRKCTKKKAKEWAMIDLKKEVEDSVQTFNYQCNSMSTTNGQTPFLSVFMYLGETDEYKEELAMLIEEFLKQRILGLKNKVGVYVTPAFPKLLYVLEEDNVHEDSKYYYLTELAAKCTAKRMVPDYISEKKMKEYKVDANGDGHCYPCMGCVDGKEIVMYRVDGQTHIENIRTMWNTLATDENVQIQPNGKDYYIDTPSVEIYDNKQGFVKNHRIIKNHNSEWLNIKFSNGRSVKCTKDHPFETSRGVVLAENLTQDDELRVDYYDVFSNSTNDYVSSTIHVISSEEVYEEGFSYDVTTESEHFMVSGIYSHNCRSFLTPYLDKDGKPKYYGRLNIGVVTLSLPDLALSSGGDEKKFWELFEERTELCHKALRCRYERFIGVKANVAPIVWEYGAFGRLNPEDDITKLIDNGYATVSLGYAGLYECVKYMTGESHTDYGIGHEFGLKVMQALNDKCEQWKSEENLAYSIYGTPIESTTYKFATKLKERFGKNVFKKLDGHDRNYITNSYHCAVFEELDPFEKLHIESEFQRLSPGGAVSYVECSDMNSNIQAVLSVIKFIYDNIMYAELNTKSDYCQVCGYDGEIKIIEEKGKHIWECPNCGNRDQNKMNVARRTCGYIGSQFWNEGRTNEISERFEHLSDINVDVIGEDIKK